MTASGKIGFGINTYDLSDLSWDRNGIYKAETFLNGKTIFGFQFDSYAFDEMRYINALIDYSRYKIMGQRVQKLFMKTPFPLNQSLCLLFLLPQYHHFHLLIQFDEFLLKYLISQELH